MYWKTTIVSLLVILVAWFVFRWRHEILLYPKYDMNFRKVSKTSDVTGPWALKHRHFSVYAVRGRRPYMEDRFHIIDNEVHGENQYYAFGIYDGHGGSFFCDYAERYLLNAITRRILLSLPGSLNVSQILIEEFLYLDQQAMKEGGSKRNMCGSTALVGIYYKHKMYLANVGDGRAVAKKLNSKDIIETVDHKPDMKDELARIKEAGGSVTFNGVWRVGGILAVSRAIGDAVLKEPGWLIATPDIYVIDLDRDPLDFMVLGSDGVWDVFSSQEVIDFVKPLIKEGYYGAKKLAKEAVKRGSSDNVAVMIVKMVDRGTPVAEHFEE